MFFRDGNGGNEWIVLIVNIPGPSLLSVKIKKFSWSVWITKFAISLSHFLSSKLVLDVRHLASSLAVFSVFQLPALCVAIVFLLHGIFFYTNSVALNSHITGIFPSIHNPVHCFPLAPFIVYISFLQFAAMYVLD